MRMTLLKKTWFPVTVIFILLALVLYYRPIFTQPYDATYMRDRFDHSQWRIPQSSTPISDETLYQVAGHDLLTGGQFFDVNPEVPPLGKYLIGLSILIFNNPQVISIPLFILAVYLFYLNTRILLKRKIFVQIATILFLLEPLIFSQISLSMLDLPLLICLLAHSWAVMKLIELKKHQLIPMTLRNTRVLLPYLTIAGVSLGAFIAIKIGFFAAPILLADALIFLYIRRPAYLLPILLLIPLTYLAVFTPYFLQGNSFDDFLTAQKWTVHFYLDSKAEPIRGMVFITMLAGFIKGWHEGAQWVRVPEWNILWPIYALAILAMLYKLAKIYKKIFQRKAEKCQPILYLMTLTILLILACAVVPFFTRYLVLVLPYCIMILTMLVINRVAHSS